MSNVVAFKPAPVVRERSRLLDSSDFPDRYNSTNPPPARDPDTEHVYKTASGAYAFEVHRWGSGSQKAFSIGHLVSPGDLGPGEKQWQRGFGEEGPLLYRLPELVGSSHETVVYLCEGEKDADTLAALGLIATSSPNGAEHWDDAYSEMLAGRPIVLFEDNDDAGRERTKWVLRSLAKYASKVSVLRFEDMPKKSDVTDFLKAGHSLDDLTARVNKSAVKDFQRDSKGTPYPNQQNVRLALRHLGVTVRHDVFKDCLMIDGLEKFGPELSDAALIRLRLMVDDRFHLKVGKELFGDIVSDTARENSFHPIRDYLDGLSWDGTPRLDNWLVTYGQAVGSDYVRAVSAIVLIAAVRRVRQPGCKFDEMLILESPQGKDKSSALAILAVKEEWFSDDLPLNQDTKLVIERMAGQWIVEAAELNGMRKGDVEHLKAFLSRRIDRARLAYGRLPVSKPRENIVVGTSNGSLYLRDQTGNRRFWPVKIEKFNLVALRRDVDQLWAEAASREAKGESIRLDEDLWKDAAIEQEERRVEDPFVDMLQAWLGDKEGKVKAVDIWSALKIQPGQRTQEQNARVGTAMKQLGWERKKLRFDGNPPEWTYVKGDGQQQIEAPF